MEKLSNSKVTIATIQKYNFAFQKRFGQNFLIDDFVIAKIIRAAEIKKSDTVLEIGPGIGTLTQYLAEAAGQVYAVEIDRNLIPILDETLADYDNVTVINDDILKTDIAALAAKSETGRLKCVANLPYYITTPIIMELLEKRLPIDSITVMIQKEFAERIAAKPGTKDYGALTLAVNYYASTSLAANVPPNCFIPRPNVGSAVINLKVLDKPSVEVRDEALMFKLIRASFNQRRKTLTNGIANSSELDFTKEQAEQALTRMGLSPTVRGETLSLEQFAELSDTISNLNS